MMKDQNMITYRGHLYRESKAKLPSSYKDDDVKAVDEVVDRFVDGIIATLKPQEISVKDFGRALSYVIETLQDKLSSDPAVSVVEPGNLPKELRK